MLRPVVVTAETVSNKASVKPRPDAITGQVMTREGGNKKISAVTTIASLFCIRLEVRRREQVKPIKKRAAMTIAYLLLTGKSANESDTRSGTKVRTASATHNYPKYLNNMDSRTVYWSTRTIFPQRLIYDHPFDEPVVLHAARDASQSFT